MKITFLSLVVPVYNEAGNLDELCNESSEVFDNLIKAKKISNYEIIIVNDGSTDNTDEILNSIKKKLKNRLRVIKLRKNFGQTPALKAGLDVCKGDVIATIDGDLQNDPKDIPQLIEKLEEGYDVVSGWRYQRKDKLTKKVFSKIMNLLRSRLVNDGLHDYGCSLKVYRRECLKDLELYGELHRYITAYLFIKGYKIGEEKVNHRPRKSGVTKYRFNRGINGILDLFFLKFWLDYSTKPLHFFGRLGIYQWILAFLIIIEQSIKAMVARELTLGPLLMLSAVLGITGLLFIIFGFLSEVLMRVYFKDLKIYSIKKVY